MSKRQGGCRRGKGEDASHLVRFQYTEWASSTGNASGPAATGATGSSSATPSGHVKRIGGIGAVDAEKIQLAFKLQTFQFILFPDAVDAVSALIVGKGGNMGQHRGASAAAATVQSILGFDAVSRWEHVYAVVVRVPKHSLVDTDETDVAASPHQCPICLEATPSAPRITPCGHIFCLPCILRALQTQKDRQQPRACPMCHAALVPSMLKRCVFRECSDDGTKVKEGCRRDFVLVHRHRLSPLVYSHQDPHLVDAVRHVTTAAAPSGTAALPPAELVVLPRAEEDASWVCCRYCLATEELHGLHDIMDRSALEDRRATHLSSVSRDASGTPVLNDDDQCELDAISSALESLDRYGFRRAVPMSSDDLHGSPLARTVPSLAAHKDPLSSYGDTASPTPSGNSIALAAQGGAASTPPTMYDLYMDAEGQQVYLHFVCTKMIHDDCVSRGVPMPTRISCDVIDVEELQQSEQTRQVLKPLAHLPLFGCAKACFADMKPLVSGHTLKLFQEVIDRRWARIQKQRERAKAEDRTAMSVDDAWEKHKAARREADPIWRTLPAEHARGIVPQLSPTMQAFAIPLDDMPSLMDLPQSTTWSAGSSSGVSRSVGGPSDSSVETRQRATKGHCGELGISGPLTAATLSSLPAPGAAPPRKSCWGSAPQVTNGAQLPTLDGVKDTSSCDQPSAAAATSATSAAALLFGKAATHGAPAAKPSWGGTPFVNREAESASSVLSTNGTTSNSALVSASVSVKPQPKAVPARRLISAEDYDAYLEENHDGDQYDDDDDDAWGGRLRGRHQGKALLADQVRPSDMVGGSSGRVAASKSNHGTSTVKVTQGKGKCRGGR